MKAIRSWVTFSVFSRFFGVAFRFTIDTAAVRLAVHLHLFRAGDSFFPADTKIVVQKGDSNGLGYGIAGGADLLVVLELAVEQCGGKGVKLAFFGHMGGAGKAQMIADGATVGLPKGDIL